MSNARRWDGESPPIFMWMINAVIFKGEDGKKHLLSIERMKNDNISISTKDACGEVILTYRNPVCIAGFILGRYCEYPICIVFVMSLYGKKFITIEKTTELC